VASSCEKDNEPSGSTKCEEFLNQLRDSQFFKKHSVPWTNYFICSYLMMLYPIR
jgi:hypothetical protein